MSDLYYLKDVCFAYNAAFRLSNVNLVVRRGSFIAFVGPNGAGKSTLLNLFALLALPASGTFEFYGEPVTARNMAKLKKHIGYVQQNPYLLRGTVSKNIELGLKLQHVTRYERLERVTAVMDMLNISALARRNVSGLSGGESQKVAIARALVLQPEVLILDEPFTFLDKHSIQELEELLVSLQKEHGKTIILTTHNQVQAQLLSDTLYSVTEGKVFASAFVNLFSGKLVDEHWFDTGKIRVRLAEASAGIEHIAIDPGQIVLSRDRLESSMQNGFSGTVRSMLQENGHIKLLIQAGEEFQVIITRPALEELSLLVGQDVWLSFKSTAIVVC